MEQESKKTALNRSYIASVRAINAKHLGALKNIRNSYKGKPIDVDGNYLQRRGQANLNRDRSLAALDKSYNTARSRLECRNK